MNKISLHIIVRNWISSDFYEYLPYHKTNKKWERFNTPYFLKKLLIARHIPYFIKDGETNTLIGLY